MSEEKKDQSQGGSAQSTAESYINEQLIKERKSLKTIRLVMGGLALFVLIYMSVLTSKIGEFTEPETAAETGLGLVQPHIATYTEQMLSQIDTQIPELVQGYPDKILEELPQYRQDIQDKIVVSVRDYATQTSEEMGSQLDAYLEAHSENIGDLLKTADDPLAAEGLAKELAIEINAYMDRNAPDGDSLRSKISMTLHALKGINDHVDHLAHSKKLTPHEDNQRRVIAILARTIDEELDNTPKASVGMFGLFFGGSGEPSEDDD